MAMYDGEIRINTKIDDTGFTKGIGKLGPAIAGLAKSAAALFAVDRIIAYGKAATMMAVNIESSMLRVADIFGNAQSSIIAFAEKTALGLGMSRKAAYEYAAIYGNLFVGMTDSAEENADMTLKYLNASAVVASKTGRTMQDTMERIRSGLLGNTEAVEDLGINVQVAQLEMTEAFQKMADGRSWEQLNFQEQQQIRMLGILEQAHMKYGDTVANSSAFTLQKFSAAMENLKTSIGSVLNVAILPIIQGLTTFANLLNTIFVAIFGKGIATQEKIAASSKQAAGGQTKLADATKKAGKAAKDALAPFDELNVLQMETAENAADAAAGLGGAAAGMDIGAGITAPAITMPEIVLPESFKTVLDKLDKLRTAFKELSSEVAEFWRNSGLEAFFAKLGEMISKTYIERLGGAIQFLTGELNMLKGIFMVLNGLITGDSTKVMEGFKEILKGLGEAIHGILIVMLGQDAADAIVKFATKWAERIAKWWVDDVAPWFTVERWKTLWVDVVTGMTDGYKTVTDWWKSDGLSKWWTNDVMPWFTYEKWFQLWTDADKSVKDGWQKIIETTDKSGPGMWFNEHIAPWFTLKKWETLLQPVEKAFDKTFTNIGETVGRLMKAAINIAIDAMNYVIDKFNRLQFQAPDWLGGDTFGIDIDRIPRLAKGAVIAPNQPFMAMLGDQRQGINIETPLDTMVEAFKTALSEMGTGGGGEVVLQLDGKTLGRAILPSIKSAENQRGVNLVMGSG